MNWKTIVSSMYIHNGQSTHVYGLN